MNRMLILYYLLIVFIIVRVHVIANCDTLYTKTFTDTTGLQPPATTVMELNGSITVTCTFATGASSTGCQVTVFMMDSMQEVLSKRIIRPHGASEASLKVAVIYCFFVSLLSLFSLSI